MEKFAILHETEKYGQVLVNGDTGNDQYSISVKWYAEELGATITAELGFKTEVAYNTTFEAFHDFKRVEKFMSNISKTWN